VATLLSLYGNEIGVELNIGDCIEVEEPITYRVLCLEEEVLDDDSELAVGQLPEADEGWDTSEGVYFIEHNDDNGVPLTAFTVHDPSHDSVPLIYHSHDGSRLELNLLQELYEALGVVADSYLQTTTANDPPHIPTLYPIVATDLDFESVVAGLNFDIPEM
jgi:hypothetical protein